MTPAEGALAGLRVLELTAAMAGPWIGRFLAWCGAEVIRIESRDHPDVVRQYVPPRAPERGVQPELSPWFAEWNAGKRFVALDLRRPEAVALVLRLAAISDVVIENFSAGVVERLGLGWEDLRRARPDLVFLGTSGLGDTGPCRSHVTWGPNVEALSGLAALSGFPDRPGAFTQYAHPDGIGALHGLVAVLAALDHRARTGEGQAIDLSQYEAAAATLGVELLEHAVTGAEPPRTGNRSRGAAPEGVYRCAGEDRWCALTIADDEAWRALCRVLGRADWASDPRLATRAGRLAQADTLDVGIEAWMAARPAEEAMARLQAEGVAAGVVQTAADLARDPQLAARGFYEEVEHLAAGRAVVTGVPLGLTGTPGRSGRAGGRVGEDNEWVLAGLLGLSRDELRWLEALGAVQPPDPR